MRRRIRFLAVLPLSVAAGALCLPAAGAAPGGPPAVAPAVLAAARQTLAPQDGWAASGTGTTGGSAADGTHVRVATNRAELVAALGGDNATNLKDATPKIVIVKGTIDANTDDAGNRLTCADYADPGYDLAAFLAAYDPATWGRVDPSGPLEQARTRSAANQTKRVEIFVGPNTTIIGMPGARLLGANLMIGNPSTSVSNVIVRNLTFEDAHDCFPAWSPTDGDTGNWNSLHDTVSLIRATNVWLDHNTFSDGNNTDDRQPVHFGRPYQVHDGLSDITKGSDLVTLSWNLYREHDKSILIGSTNTPGDPTTSPTADLGRLRVTLHHNLFANLGQRVPRVRFGQVDLFNNYYYATDEDTYAYSWGVGVQSAIHAENNVLLRSADIPLDAVVHGWGGTRLTERGTLTRVGTGPLTAVSLLGAYNATHTPTLGDDAGWTPTLRTRLDPAPTVPATVTAGAGAGKIPMK